MSRPSDPDMNPAVIAVGAAVMVVGLCLLFGLLRYPDVFGIKGLLIGGSAAGVGYYAALTFLDWHRPKK